MPGKYAEREESEPEVSVISGSKGGGATGGLGCAEAPGRARKLDANKLRGRKAGEKKGGERRKEDDTRLLNLDQKPRAGTSLTPAAEGQRKVSKEKRKKKKGRVRRRRLYNKKGSREKCRSPVAQSGKRNKAETRKGEKRDNIKCKRDRREYSPGTKSREKRVKGGGKRPERTGEGLESVRGWKRRLLWKAVGMLRPGIRSLFRKSRKKNSPEKMVDEEKEMKVWTDQTRVFIKPTTNEDLP